MPTNGVRAAPCSPVRLRWTYTYLCTYSIACYPLPPRTVARCRRSTDELNPCTDIAMGSFPFSRSGFSRIKENMMASDLYTAILSGQYHLAYEMVFRGANVNVPIKIANRDPVMSLLHYAVVKKRDAECIRVLANLGANFNACDSMKQTPLHWAVRYNVSPDVVEMLIGEGAFVDPRDEHQKTPLHHAAVSNSIELAEKLIAGGASINAIDAHGRSVLHEAVMYHNLEMVKMLISHRVNIDAKDICEDTPLLCYMQHRRKEDETEIVSIL